MTTGLYQIDEFKDNCGFGLIAHLKGATSHRLLMPLQAGNILRPFA